MSGETFLAALGMVLVLEGLLPFLSPARWRGLFAQVAAMRDGQIRFVGLAAVGAGLLLISLS